MGKTQFVPVGEWTEDVDIRYPHSSCTQRKCMEITWNNKLIQFIHRHGTKFVARSWQEQNTSAELGIQLKLTAFVYLPWFYLHSMNIQLNLWNCPISSVRDPSVNSLSLSRCSIVVYVLLSAVRSVIRFRCVARAQATLRAVQKYLNFKNGVETVRALQSIVWKQFQEHCANRRIPIETFRPFSPEWFDECQN